MSGVDGMGSRDGEEEAACPNAPTAALSDVYIQLLRIVPNHGTRMSLACCMNGASASCRYASPLTLLLPNCPRRMASLAAEAARATLLLRLNVRQLSRKYLTNCSVPNQLWARSMLAAMLRSPTAVSVGRSEASDEFIRPGNMLCDPQKEA